MRGFEKFEEKLLSKGKLYSSLIDKKLVIKIMRILLRFGKHLK